MTYQEALKVIKTISIYYQNFVITEDRVKEWALVIQEYDLQPTMNNLKEYAKENKFPPTLSDLITSKEIEKPIKHAGYLPNTAESMQINSEQARQMLEYLEPKRLNIGVDNVVVEIDTRKQLKKMMDSIRGGN